MGDAPRMDFWTTVAAVIVGVSLWRFFGRFRTPGDREEMRIEREREEAERHWESLSESDKQQRIEAAQETMKKMGNGR